MVEQRQRRYTEERPQCKAKSKQTGQRCKNSSVPGYKVCRFHGANPNNRGGAPKGNKNGVKTGEMEVIYLDKLTPEERELFYKVNTDNVTQLDEEIRLLSIRERRMLERIEKIMEGWEEEEIEITYEAKTSKGKKPVTVFGEDGVISVDFDLVREMVETERVEKKRAKLERVLSIEEALTRVQKQKSRLIELKYRVESDASGNDDGSLAQLAEVIKASVDALGQLPG